MPSFTPAPRTGQETVGETVTRQQRRALRKLLRDLITFSGVSVANLAAMPRKPPQQNRQRLLYRRADTLTDAEVTSIVAEIGIDRCWPQPSLPLAAAE